MKTMDELKKLNLTEKDFEMIIDGLDALPEKGFGGRMMVDLIGSMVLKSEESKEKFFNERKIEAEKQEREKDILREDIKMLQGKLITLKRYLKENEILESAKDILLKP